MVFGKGGKANKKKVTAHKSTRNKVQRSKAMNKLPCKQKRPNEAADEGRPVSGKKKQAARPSRSEADALGKIHINEEQFRIYYLICYQCRFDEPAEGDWPECVATIQSEVGGTKETITRVCTFRDAATGDPYCYERKAGTGAKRKLERDNPGLTAAALAMNVGVPPTLAVEICNSVNNNNNIDISVCRNTLISTLRAYTDVQSCRIQRRKTGSKNLEGDWAVARLTSIM